ncbi:tRNA (N6-isopentenyl adenosine(37)-C2)-methylthiotransferase MiaB [Breznakiellaceae bacterium SP9]
MTYFFETYGCQMNAAESVALKLVLKERGWQQADTGAEADLVLLNTCAVRTTAEQRVRGRLDYYASLKKKLPQERAGFALIVAGCMAERIGEALKEQHRAVDYVMGTAAREQFPFIVQEVEQRLQGTEHAPKAAVFAVDKHPFVFSKVHFDLETSGAALSVCSYIPIMHGCNNYCSYCIVPYVRGREVSRDPAAIMEEIRLAAKKGIKEITLLGQNVNSYARESGGGEAALDFPGLLELCAIEAQRSGIGRLRFLSSHPKDLSLRTIEVMARRPIFCRHLHLCVQHGSNAILAAMNRKYTREQYLALVANIRGAIPAMTFSTDLLIGFPGETEDDLAQTFELMDEVRFLYAFMFHYNPREGTAAFSLPWRIDESVKKERLARVIERQHEHTAQLLKARLGQRVRVLIEGISRKNADDLIMRTEHDEVVAAKGSAGLIGRFADCTLKSLTGNTFRAEAFDLLPSALH